MLSFGENKNNRFLFSFFFQKKFRVQGILFGHSNSINFGIPYPMYNEFLYICIGGIFSGKNR